MAETNKKKKTTAQSGAKKTTTKKAPASAAKKKAATAPVFEKKESTGRLGFAVICAVAVFFVLLCCLGESTILGEYIRPLFCGFIGEPGLVAVPIYLVLVLIYWFDDRKKEKTVAKWWVSSLSFFILLVVLHFFFTKDVATQRGFSANMWANGRKGIGTGIIGGYGFALLDALMGTPATLCVLICTYILTLPLLFDSTPLRVFRSIVNSLRNAVIQSTTNNDYEDEDLEPVPVKNENTGRGGVELRVPEQKKETKGKKKFDFPEEDDSYDEPLPLPDQIEINRTAKKKTPPAVIEQPVPPVELEEPLFEELPSEIQEVASVTEEKTADDIVFTDPVADEENGEGKYVLSLPSDKPLLDNLVTGAAYVSTESADSAAVETSDKDNFTVLPLDDPFGAESAPVEDTIPVTEEIGESDAVEITKVEPEKVYIFPPMTLLSPKEKGSTGFSPEEIRRTSERLEQTLANFNVRAKVVNTSSGPSLTRYEVQPEPGVRVRTIANLHDDIALHLEADSIRMEAPIPGKAAVGIEIPNKHTNLVRLRELLEAPAFEEHPSKLYCCLGVDVVGKPVYLDVAKMPHLLIAGATGMGKSVCINSLIVSLLYRARPDEVKLILIDPKKVEFADYNGIPHLLVPVVTEPKKAAGTLSWAVMEMERRFSEIQDVGARNLEEYNSITADDPEKDYIPQVVIVIDELADLMMTAPTEVENSICRLAQKARAAGMYLIIGTQRPSVDVITGLIKANVPSRIACKVASQVDSRTILDVAGAEKLLGRGDMLYNPVGVMKAIRVQGAFVEGKEVIAVCTYLKQAAQAEYNEDVMKMIEKEAQLCGEKPSKRAAAENGEDDNDTDPLEMQALEIAVESDTISTSLIQRRLSVGYARAARIIDKLERKGFVGAFDAAAKKRKVLISKEALLQMKLNKADSNDLEGDEQ